MMLRFSTMRLYAATGTYIPVDGGFLTQWKLQELKQTPNAQRSTSNANGGATESYSCSQLVGLSRANPSSSGALGLGATHWRIGPACFPNFFKSRSNVSRSLFERTLTTVSIAAACSRNPRVISARPFAVSSTRRTRRSPG
jgi:hypothetical protein